MREVQAKPLDANNPLRFSVLRVPFFSSPSIRETRVGEANRGVWSGNGAGRGSLRRKKGDIG